MKISIKNNINNKFIWMSVNCSNSEEILLKEQLYKKILLRLLNGCSINLITVAPQKYSLAYDIIPYHLRIINSASFLINNISKCDIELVEKIVLSEEFRRTLLITVKKASLLSDSEISKIIELIKSESHISEELIFCEDDGDSLCIYNSTIDITELMSISNSIASGIKIELI